MSEVKKTLFLIVGGIGTVLILALSGYLLFFTNKNNNNEFIPNNKPLENEKNNNKVDNKPKTENKEDEKKVDNSKNNDNANKVVDNSSQGKPTEDKKDTEKESSTSKESSKTPTKTNSNKLIYKNSDSSLEIIKSLNKEYEDEVKKMFKNLYNNVCKVKTESKDIGFDQSINCQDSEDKNYNNIFGGSLSNYLKDEYAYLGIYNGKPIIIEKIIQEDSNYLVLAGADILHTPSNCSQYNFIVDKRNKAIVKDTEQWTGYYGFIKTNKDYYFIVNNCTMPERDIYTADGNKKGKFINKSSDNKYVYVATLEIGNGTKITINKYDENSKIVLSSDPFKGLGINKSVFYDKTLWILIIDNNNSLCLYNVETKEKVEVLLNLDESMMRDYYLNNYSLTIKGNFILINVESKIYTYDITNKKISGN